MKKFIAIIFLCNVAFSYSQGDLIYTNDKDSIVDKSIATCYKRLYFDSVQNRKIKEMYSINGILKFKISYLWDVKDGAYFSYYSNGLLSESGNFKSDSRIGRWLDYHTNGKLACIINFDGYNKVVSCDSCWNEEGRMVKCIREEKPSFPGGEDKMKHFLSKNIIYPKEGDVDNSTGETIVLAELDCFGIVMGAKIFQSSNSIVLDKEALRVVKMMPAWNPAQFYSKPINAYVRVPVNFKK